MDDEKKIECILKWAEYNTSFNTDFVDSLLDQLLERELSSRQTDALDTIISKFSINIYEWLS